MFNVCASATYQSVHDALERIQWRRRRALLLLLSHGNNCLGGKVTPSRNTVEFESRDSMVVGLGGWYGQKVEKRSSTRGEMRTQTKVSL